MNTGPTRSVLAYLIHTEDTSSERLEGWQPPAAAKSSAPQRLAQAKAALWTVIALAAAYGISRLSAAHITF